MVRFSLEWLEGVKSRGGKRARIDYLSFSFLPYLDEGILSFSYLLEGSLLSFGESLLIYRRYFSLSKRVFFSVQPPTSQPTNHPGHQPPPLLLKSRLPPSYPRRLILGTSMNFFKNFVKSTFLLPLTNRLKPCYI